MLINAKFASWSKCVTTERHERGRRPVKWSDPQPRSGEDSRPEGPRRKLLTEHGVGGGVTEDND